MHEEILQLARQIAFTCRKSSVSLPCSVQLKQGLQCDMAELTIVKQRNHDFKQNIYHFDEVVSISVSKYTLSNSFRKAALEAKEYRNDRPFFLKSRKGQILGYNAINPVNFTYCPDIIGTDIIACMDFNQASEIGFRFVEHHHKIPVKILYPYDPILFQKILNMPNSIH